MIIITRIIPYSLRNKKTKDKLPNSILNPLISSLSPSKRSKGARFVSIKDNKNQITNQTIFNSNPLLKDKLIMNLFDCASTTKKTKIKATSKESLCNNPRRLPNFEKALNLLQPTRITV